MLDPELETHGTHVTVDPGLGSRGTNVMLDPGLGSRGTHVTLDPGLGTWTQMLGPPHIGTPLWADLCR